MEFNDRLLHYRTELARHSNVPIIFLERLLRSPFLFRAVSLLLLIVIYEKSTHTPIFLFSCAAGQQQSRKQTAIVDRETERVNICH